MRWRRRHHGEDGWLSSRGVGVAVTTVAVIAAGFGIAGTGKGGAPTTSPTTTTVLATTTTTVPGTTTSSGPTTTTTTGPIDPTCTAENGGIPGFPCSTNTGVPAGTVLTAYTGPSTITSCGTVIDSKTISGGLDIRVTNGTLVTAAGAASPCVTIRNSRILGQVDTSFATTSVCPLNGVAKPCGPLLMSHVEINFNNANDANVIEANYVAEYVNQIGGRTGFLCDGYCLISHSYSHDNWLVGAAHMGGTLSNGNSGRPIWIDSSTIRCNVKAGSPQGDSNGGCSSDINNFGDFGTIQNVTVTNNLLRSSDGFYCAYTGANQPAKPNKTGTNLVWRNNVFERGPSGICGSPGGGAVADWAANSGNVWCNNRFDNGSIVGLPASTPGC